MRNSNDDEREGNSQPAPPPLPAPDPDLITTERRGLDPITRPNPIPQPAVERNEN
jgi:hypothetical protein